MQNFDSAIAANQTALNAQGSAMKENERFMESYEAKINGLKAAWQNLSTSVVEGDLVKGGVSALTGFVNALSESKVAVMAIQTLLASGAIWGGSQLIRALRIFKEIGKQFKNLSTIISSVKAGTGLTTAITAVGGAASAALPVILGVVAAVVALGTAYKAIEEAKYEKSFENQNKILQDMTSNYNEMKSEYETLMDKGDKLTDTEKNRLNYLQKQLDILQSQSDVEGSIAEQEEKTWDAWSEEFEESMKHYGLRVEQEGKRFASSSVQMQYGEDFKRLLQYGADYQAGQISGKEYAAQLASYIVSYREYVDTIKEAQAAGKELTAAEQNLVTLWDVAKNTQTELGKEIGVDIELLNEEFGEFSTLEDKIKDVTAAIEEYQAAMSIDYSSSAQSYKSAYEQFLEDYKSGKAARFQPAIDLLLTDEVKSQFHNDIDAEAEYLANSFKEGIGQVLLSEDPVLAFGDLLRQNLDASGNLIANINGETKNLITTLDDGTYTISSYGDLAEYFKTTPEVIEAMFQGLQEYNSGLIITEEDISNLADRMQSLAGDTNIASLGMSDIVSLIGQAAETADPEVIAQWGQALERAGAINFAPTVESIQEVQAQLAETGEQKEEVGEDVDSTITIDALVNDQQVKDLQATLNGLNGSTISIGVKVGGGLGIFRNASGTRNFAGGLSLVNDGTPVNGSAKELIVQDGQAFIANGEPALVNLKKGAQVYTAAETQQILGGIPAFAAGTSQRQSADGALKPKAKSAGGIKLPSTNIGVNTGSGGSSGNGGVNTPAQSAKELKEEFDKLLKEKKHALAMDEITEREYYDWLTDANEKYLADREEYLDEYWRHQEEIYNYEKQALKDEITLEEKLNELQKAKTQQVLVYKDGMFQYVSNTEAIARAQREVAAYGGGTQLLDNSGIVGDLGGIGNGTFASSGSTNITNINVGEVTLEKADNVDELFEGLSNLALQKSMARG